MVESIIEPWKSEDRVLPMVGLVKTKLPQLLSRYLPRISTVPLHQGMEWTPTWKALPTFRLTQE